METKVTIRTRIHPTEDQKQVRAALNNLFPDVDFSCKSLRLGKDMRGTKEFIAIFKGIELLQNFKDTLAKQQIRSAARGLLTSGIAGNTLKFSVNKQAAAAGKINFVDFEVPLGAIDVEITAENPQEIVDWLSEGFRA